MYTRYTQVEKDSVFDVAENSMQKATQKAILHNEAHSPRNLNDVYGTTWQKRWHWQKFGYRGINKILQ